MFRLHTGEPPIAPTYVADIWGYRGLHQQLVSHRTELLTGYMQIFVKQLGLGAAHTLQLFWQSSDLSLCQKRQSNTWLLLAAKILEQCASLTLMARGNRSQCY